MIVEVDPDSPVPPYEQLRQQVTAMVAIGQLTPGARLPSIRQLADDLGVAPGTVGRAYRELEVDGVVVSRGRHGTVVADAAARRTAPAPDLLGAARRYATAARRAGAGLDEAVAVLRAAFAGAKEQQ